MAQALEEKIPCEFCEQLIPLINYDSHWRKCSQDFKKAARQSTAQSDAFAIPCEFCEKPINSTEYDRHTRQCNNRNSPFQDYDPVPIPCEYCDKLIQAHEYDAHEKQCRRKHNALINQSDDIAPNVKLSNNSDWPEYWDATATQNLTRYVLNQNSQEYAFVTKNFHSTLPQNQIIQIERIQNRRWYRQYAAHRDDFIERYGNSTEQWLFHGCRHGNSAELIIKDCFNRSHAVNCAVGQGIYFTTKAAISLGYTAPDAQGRRHMFMARVLVGKTTRGTRTTRVCPPGYDTTGGGDVFVTYHDAQAYGQYIIVFR